MRIGTTRPYEPLEMTTDLWSRIQPERVELDRLTTCQDGLTIHGLMQHHAGMTTSWCNDPYIHVVHHDGHLYISDGHHRTILALLRGERTIRARVLTPPHHHEPT